MKILFLNLLVCSFASTAFSQNSITALPDTLPRTMKAMNADLKQISLQANQVSKNSSSAVLADDFTSLVLHAKMFVPDSVRSLPKAQQPAAKARFDQRLSNVAKLGKELADAFRASRNTVAVSILKQLSQEKKEGHQEFNP